MRESNHGADRSFTVHYGLNPLRDVDQKALNLVEAWLAMILWKLQITLESVEIVTPPRYMYSDEYTPNNCVLRFSRSPVTDNYFEGVKSGTLFGANPQPLRQQFGYRSGFTTDAHTFINGEYEYQVWREYLTKQVSRYEAPKIFIQVEELQTDPNDGRSEYTFDLSIGTVRGVHVNPWYDLALNDTRATPSECYNFLLMNMDNLIRTASGSNIARRHQDEIKRLLINYYDTLNMKEIWKKHYSMETGMAVDMPLQDEAKNIVDPRATMEMINSSIAEQVPLATKGDEE